MSASRVSTPEANEDDLAKTQVFRALAEAGLSGAELVEMPGGLSTRRFFRAARSAAEPERRWVAMYIPAPHAEIQKSARQAMGGASFVEVARLLETFRVRVPRIIANHPQHDTLIVEDLGDDTLAEVLLRSPAAGPDLYRTAVQMLARAQQGFESLTSPCIVHERAFDDELLAWELDHFREWGLEAGGTPLSDAEGRLFVTARDYLARRIASLPRGFVHRDYQSRNLMVQGVAPSFDLAWIDFQDAMLGPRTYDLVALLMDSYQSFGQRFVDERLEEYAAFRGASRELAALRTEFDLITVQRKLKDAGRFVFFSRTKGDDSYLKYVDSTVHRARSALRRVAEQSEALTGLAELLAARLGPLTEVEPPVEK